MPFSPAVCRGKVWAAPAYRADGVIGCLTGGAHADAPLRPALIVLWVIALSLHQFLQPYQVTDIHNEVAVDIVQIGIADGVA